MAILHTKWCLFSVILILLTPFETFGQSLWSELFTKGHNFCSVAADWNGDNIEEIAEFQFKESPNKAELRIKKGDKIIHSLLFAPEYYREPWSKDLLKVEGKLPFVKCEAVKAGFTPQLTLLRIVYLSGNGVARKTAQYFAIIGNRLRSLFSILAAYNSMSGSEGTVCEFQPIFPYQPGGIANTVYAKGSCTSHYLGKSALIQGYFQIFAFQSVRGVSTQLKIESWQVSSEMKGQGTYNFEAKNLGDGWLSHCWQPTTSPSSGLGTWFKADLGREQIVSQISIANGFQSNDNYGDQFFLNNRIKTAMLYFSDKSSLPITFEKNKKGFSNFTFSSRKTRWIKVKVISIFKGSKWNDLAVSEVSIFGE